MPTYRDVSAITNLRTCTYVDDADTIYAIGSGALSRPVDEYQLIGNKYLLINANATSGMTIPGGTVCLTSTTITQLESNLPIINTTNTTVDFTSVNDIIKDVALPFYHEMAIISAILIFYAAYRLIIYPFFRSK